MLGRLKAILKNTLGDTVEVEADLEHDVRLACAVLLIDAARSDHDAHDDEMQVVERLLRERFELAPDETAALVKHAGEELDHSVALQGFTRQLMDTLDEAERGSLVGMLWEVVYADGKVHAWEEHLVRRIADLLYVPHAEFIRHKLKAQEKVDK
ncbi:MAG TPA: TerB family tellurite resistance protein [Gammaproteobacteria bacterium]